MEIQLTNRPDKMKSERGFSMTELLVATAIMLIVLVVVMSQLGEAVKIGNTTSELTAAQQSLRTAHEYIQRDLIAAGDGLSGINGVRVPSAFVTNYLTRTPVLAVDGSGNETDAGYVTLPIIAYDNEVYDTANNVAINVLRTNTTTPQTTERSVYVGTDDSNQRYFTDRISLLVIDPAFGTNGNISLSGYVSGNTSNPRVLNNGEWIRFEDIFTTTAAFTAQDFDRGDIYYFTNGSTAAFGMVTAVTNSGGQRRLRFANVTDSGAANVISDLGINVVDANGPINRVSIAPVTEENPTPPRENMVMMRMRLVHYFVNDLRQLIRRTFGVGLRANGVQTNPSFFDVVVAENVSRLQFRYKLDDFSQPRHVLATDAQQKAVSEIEVDVEVQTIRPVMGTRSQRIGATTSTSIRNLQFGGS